jgi:hypothetical protein
MRDLRNIAVLAENKKLLPPERRVGVISRLIVLSRRDGG